MTAPSPSPSARTGRHRSEPAAGLHVLGVSFRTAPLAVREPLALDEAKARAALADARSCLHGGEALILSTCNRTELYVVGAEADAVEAWHRGVLGAAGADSACPALAGARYHLRDQEAAAHLFRVAAGLESSMLGDNEIVGQLRAAARLADDAGMLGPRLRLLVDRALHTSKRARSETAIGAGGAGVGSAVAGVVAARRPAGGRVALVGAGDAAAVIARELAKRLRVDLQVVNRSLPRAEALAAQHGGSAAPLDHLAASLRQADVVVTATGAPAPIITPAVVAAVRELDPTWRPLVIDAGFPRNVDPRCDLEITTMESLAERTRRLTRLRERAVADVERCIDDGLRQWWDAEAKRHTRARAERTAHPITPVPTAC